MGKAHPYLLESGVDIVCMLRVKVVIPRLGKNLFRKEIKFEIIKLISCSDRGNFARFFKQQT